jgi:hypothetical protein
MRLPILMISNYRCGSNSLIIRVGNKLGLECFPEPHRDPEKHRRFLELREGNSKRYIVKIMADQLAAYPEYSAMIDEDCFKIRLRRADRIAQIASHYVATVTDRWRRQQGEQVARYVLPLDTELLQRSADIIDRNEDLLTQLDSMRFDQDLVYESLGYIDNGYNDVSVQPDNIEDIKSAIKMLTVK